MKQATAPHASLTNSSFAESERVPHGSAEDSQRADRIFGAPDSPGGTSRFAWQFAAIQSGVACAGSAEPSQQAAPFRAANSSSKGSAACTEFLNARATASRYGSLRLTLVHGRSSRRMNRHFKQWPQAQPRGDVGHRADGGVIKRPSKPMVPSVAKPCAMPMPKPISCPRPLQVVVKAPMAFSMSHTRTCDIHAPTVSKSSVLKSCVV
jgi:hypothetical protein